MEGLRPKGEVQPWRVLLYKYRHPVVESVRTHKTSATALFGVAKPRLRDTVDVEQSRYT